MAMLWPMPAAHGGRVAEVFRFLSDDACATLHEAQRARGLDPMAPESRSNAGERCACDFRPVALALSMTQYWLPRAPFASGIALNVQGEPASHHRPGARVSIRLSQPARTGVYVAMRTARLGCECRMTQSVSSRVLPSIRRDGERAFDGRSMKKPHRAGKSAQAFEIGQESTLEFPLTLRKVNDTHYCGRLVRDTIAPLRAPGTAGGIGKAVRFRHLLNAVMATVGAIRHWLWPGRSAGAISLSQKTGLEAIARRPR